jgi:uncharacterized membrane protein YccC
MVNMTAVPTVLSEFLNIPEVASGLLISVLVICAVVVGMGLLQLHIGVIAGSIIGMVIFFTLIDWSNIWIAIFMALAVAGMVGMRVRSMATGTGELT